MNDQQKILLVRAHADRGVTRLLRNQVQDSARKEYGGIWEPHAGWASQKSGMNALAPLILSYCDKESAHYRSPAVHAAITKAFVFCDRYQRPDGTFDLFDCNFFSAPDTAFGVQSLWRAYGVLEKTGEAPDLLELLKRLIDSSVEGVAAGGFHTPNHRWVNTSALLIGWKLTGKAHFYARAKEYLAEGIDCTKDGEFTERSTGVYNVVNDYALLLIAELLEEEEYLTYVRRNLDMMITFYEPDGSVFTMNSTRQDNGQHMFPPRYYALYYYMGEKLQLPEYFSFASMIFDALVTNHQDLTELYGAMLHSPSWGTLPEYPAATPTAFQVLYPDSGIARIRQGDFTATFIRNNPTPFAVQLGEICLYMRVGISFFSLRNLLTQTLEQFGEGYRMTMQADGCYKKPFADYDGSPFWDDMDHSQRETIVAARLSVTMDLIPVENGVDLRICASGCDKIPFKFEFGLPAGVQVDNSHFSCVAQPGFQLIAREGQVRLDDGKAGLTFGPAFADHSFIRSRGGIVEPSDRNMNLYFTAFSEFDRTISFRYEK